MAMAQLGRLVALGVAVAAAVVAGVVRAPDAAAFRPKVPPAAPPPSPAPGAPGAGAPGAGAPAIDVGAALGAAIRARDTAGVIRLLADPVRNHGILFSDPGCARRYGEPAELAGSQRSGFARCLTTLGLQPTDRRPGAPGDFVLAYAPGIELEGGSRDNRVQWIGFQSPSDGTRGRPTLTAKAFEALRTAGSTNVDDAVREQLDRVLVRLRAPLVSLWLKVCVDAKGGVDEVLWRPPPGAPPGVDLAGAAMVAAARTWKLRPYLHRGKAIPACSMSLVTYPAARAPLVETLPIAQEAPRDPR